ncbi:ABC transporter ATP-binding protein [Olivibacter sp. CPCC 100613]|uniref:ABC transporter ATP-binding protein n=1 Tax=Olivibacter sp. CPCC 100613 TaxID=3079931 RepID=UPI002FFC0A46
MKLLLNYLKAYQGRFLLMLLLTAISQSCLMLNPYIIGNCLIDPLIAKSEFFRSRNLGGEFSIGIAKGMVALVGVTTAFWSIKAFKDFILSKIVKEVGSRIYLDVQASSFTLPYNEYETSSSGQILFIMQRVKQDVETFLLKSINIVFASLVNLCVVIFITYKFSPVIPVIYVIAVLLFCVFVNSITGKLLNIQNDILKESSSLSGKATESLRNIEIIRSYNLVDKVLGKLGFKVFKVLEIEKGKAKQIQKISCIYLFVFHTMQQLTFLMLVYFVFIGTMTLGQLVMMQLYFIWIFGTLEEMGGVVMSFRETQASLLNVQNFKEKIASMKVNVSLNTLDAGRITRLSFDGVTFKYEFSRDWVLQDLSFQIQKGETVAIVGRSGSGKSTLTKLLIGLYQPNRGKIYYNGIDQSEVDYSGVRNQLGLVSQDSNLFSGTIRENLLFANTSATDEMIVDALTKASCLELLVRSDEGLDTIIGENGIKLSGGEKQRIAIARALLRNVSIFIFDEATSSLDSITELEISESIKVLSASNNYMTIVIAHRLSTIKFADRILVLHDGKVAEEGNHCSLLAKKGLYSSLWDLQVNVTY